MDSLTGERKIYRLKLTVMVQIGRSTMVQTRQSLKVTDLQIKKAKTGRPFEFRLEFKSNDVVTVMVTC